MTRQIDPLALRQLEAWSRIADTWTLIRDMETPHIRCGVCGLSVIRLADNQGQVFQYSPEDIKALTVAHLRNHHPTLDPCEDIK